MGKVVSESPEEPVLPNPPVRVPQRRNTPELYDEGCKTDETDVGPEFSGVHDRPDGEVTHVWYPELPKVHHNSDVHMSYVLGTSKPSKVDLKCSIQFFRPTGPSSDGVVSRMSL